MTLPPFSHLLCVCVCVWVFLISVIWVLLTRYGTEGSSFVIRTMNHKRWGCYHFSNIALEQWDNLCSWSDQNCDDAPLTIKREILKTLAKYSEDGTNAWVKVLGGRNDIWSCYASFAHGKLHRVQFGWHSCHQSKEAWEIRKTSILDKSLRSQTIQEVENAIAWYSTSTIERAMTVASFLSRRDKTIRESNRKTQST